MVELAATIIVLVFVGYMLNSFGRWRDVRRLDRGVRALIAQRDAETDEGKREELDKQIDEAIELIERVEQRDISPLK